MQSMQDRLRAPPRREVNESSHRRETVDYDRVLSAQLQRVGQ
jgi:hypothetical protein